MGRKKRPHTTNRGAAVDREQRGRSREKGRERIFDKEIADHVARLDSTTTIAADYDDLLYPGQSKDELRAVFEQIDGAGVFSDEWLAETSATIAGVMEDREAILSRLQEKREFSLLRGYSRRFSDAILQMQEDAYARGILSGTLTREVVDVAVTGELRAQVDDAASADLTQLPSSIIWQMIERYEKQGGEGFKNSNRLRLLLASELLRRKRNSTPEQIEQECAQGRDYFDLVRDESLQMSQGKDYVYSITWNAGAGRMLFIHVKFSSGRDSLAIGQIQVRNKDRKLIGAMNLSRFNGEICAPQGFLIPAVNQLGEQVYNDLYSTVWNAIGKGIENGDIITVDEAIVAEVDAGVNGQGAESKAALDAAQGQSERIDVHADDRSFKERLLAELAHVPNEDIEIPNMPTKMFFRTLRACGADISRGGSHWIAEINGYRHSLGLNSDTFYTPIIHEILDSLDIPRAEFACQVKGRIGRNLQRTLAKEHGVE